MQRNRRNAPYHRNQRGGSYHRPFGGNRDRRDGRDRKNYPPPPRWPHHLPMFMFEFDPVEVANICVQFLHDHDSTFQGASAALGNALKERNLLFDQQQIEPKRLERLLHLSAGSDFQVPQMHSILAYYKDNRDQEYPCVRFPLYKNVDVYSHPFYRAIADNRDGPDPSRGADRWVDRPPAMDRGGEHNRRKENYLERQQTAIDKNEGSRENLVELSNDRKAEHQATAEVENGEKKDDDDEEMIDTPDAGKDEISGTIPDDGSSTGSNDGDDKGGESAGGEREYDAENINEMEEPVKEGPKKDETKKSFIDSKSHEGNKADPSEKEGISDKDNASEPSDKKDVSEGSEKDNVSEGSENDNVSEGSEKGSGSDMDDASAAAGKRNDISEKSNDLNAILQESDDDLSELEEDDDLDKSKTKGSKPEPTDKLKEDENENEDDPLAEPTKTQTPKENPKREKRNRGEKKNQTPTSRLAHTRGRGGGFGKDRPDGNRLRDNERAFDRNEAQRTPWDRDKDRDRGRDWDREGPRDSNWAMDWERERDRDRERDRARGWDRVGERDRDRVGERDRDRVGERDRDRDREWNRDQHRGDREWDRDRWNREKNSWDDAGDREREMARDPHRQWEHDWRQQPPSQQREYGPVEGAAAEPGVAGTPHWTSHPGEPNARSAQWVEAAAAPSGRWHGVDRDRRASGEDDRWGYQQSHWDRRMREGGRDWERDHNFAQDTADRSNWDHHSGNRRETGEESRNWQRPRERYDDRAPKRQRTNSNPDPPLDVVDNAMNARKSGDGPSRQNPHKNFKADTVSGTSISTKVDQKTRTFNVKSNTKNASSEKSAHAQSQEPKATPTPKPKSKSTTKPQKATGMANERAAASSNSGRDSQAKGDLESSAKHGKVDKQKNIVDPKPSAAPQPEAKPKPKGRVRLIRKTLASEPQSDAGTMPLTSPSKKRGWKG